jgi:hypothetical protein
MIMYDPKKHLEEILTNIRTLFQVLVGWFAFFLTTVGAALAFAFSASHSDTGALLMEGAPIIAVALFFTLQSVFGLLGCNSFRREIDRAEAMIIEMVGGPQAARGMIPVAFKTAAVLMVCTLAANLIVLPALAAYYAWWAGAGS